MPIASPRSGGRILVDQLVAQGVAQVYCIPGESYLAVLDALYDSKVEVVVCWGGDRGADRGTPDRAGWSMLRHARSGRDQRSARRPYRRAQFGSDDSVHWPGWTRDAWAGAFQEMDYRAFSARPQNGSPRSKRRSKSPKSSIAPFISLCREGQDAW